MIEYLLFVNTILLVHILNINIREVSHKNDVMICSLAKISICPSKHIANRKLLTDFGVYPYNRTLF